MQRRRFRPVQSFIAAVTVALLGCGIRFELIPHASAASTSSGSTSEVESQTLWEDGKKAFTDSRFSEAARHLQRLMDRYPGDPHQTEAMEILGETYLQLELPTQATPLLLAAAALHPREAQGLKLKLLAGESYLAAQKYDEALLTVQEIERTENDPEFAKVLTKDLFAQAILLKGRTHLAKNNFNHAQLSIVSLEGQIPQLTSPEVKTQIYRFLLEMGLMQCAKISTPGQMKETQIKKQMQRRSICIIEKMATSKPLFLEKNPKTQAFLSQQIMTALGELKKIYRHPPAPPDTQGQKRTRQELTRYRSELSLLLRPIYRETVSQARELLENWKSQSPPEGVESLANFLKDLRALDA